MSFTPEGQPRRFLFKFSLVVVFLIIFSKCLLNDRSELTVTLSEALGIVDCLEFSVMGGELVSEGAPFVGDHLNLTLVRIKLRESVPFPLPQFIKIYLEKIFSILDWDARQGNGE